MSSKNTFPLPSQEYLRLIFDYDEIKGELIWKKRPKEHFVTEAASKTWNTRYEGTVAGAIDKSRGYKHTTIDRVVYYNHRIIWKYYYGNDPMYTIDHIDGNKSNNCIKNLRDATHSENRSNKPSTTNTSGYKGVGVGIKADGTMYYYTQIKKHGIVKYLGTFNTPEDAHEVYKKAASEIHGEFANTKIIKRDEK